VVVVCTVILLPFGAGHYGQANRRIGYFAVRSTVAMFGGTSALRCTGAFNRSRCHEALTGLIKGVAMSFGQAIASGFSNYANFSGRASWPEFWFWVLFAALGAIVTNIIDAAIFVYHPGVSPLNSPLSNIFTIIALLPSLAVATRRLHDVERTGWWMLLLFTGVGIFVLIYWLYQDGTSGPNRFGPDPRDVRNFARA
jgi:uncharacterized membrane protein YhaH (DUF805 family)